MLRLRTRAPAPDSLHITDIMKSSVVVLLLWLHFCNVSNVKQWWLVYQRIIITRYVVSGVPPDLGKKTIVPRLLSDSLSQSLTECLLKMKDWDSEEEDEEVTGVVDGGDGQENSAGTSSPITSSSPGSCEAPGFISMFCVNALVQISVRSRRCRSSSTQPRYTDPTPGELHL